MKNVLSLELLSQPSYQYFTSSQLVVHYHLKAYTLHTSFPSMISINYFTHQCNYVTRLMNEIWYLIGALHMFQLKEAILEGGIPFNRVYGTHTFEYPGLDPRLNLVFNTTMFNHLILLLRRFSSLTRALSNSDNQLILVEVQELLVT